MKKAALTILLVVTLLLTCFALVACDKEYTVTWQGWDGTVLEVDSLKEGTIPTYDGATPTKEGNGQYAYEFSGWDKEIGAVTGDTVYVAQFNEILLSYPIVWQNWDGTILEQSNENYGAFPSYSGETPVREATAEYTYTFSGWSPTVDTVTGGITYVAQFTSTVNTYSITWQNWDGTILQMSTVPYGEMPSYPGYDDPRKAPEEQYSFIFSGWSPSVEAVTGDATYVAEFTAEPRIYTVYWRNWDDSYLAEGECEYGATPEYPDYPNEPTRYSDEQYIYTFSGWSSTVDVVAGTITYVAEFSKELQRYTVTWKNWEDTTLETDENVEYGTMPTYDGEAPVREPWLGEIYIFSGWSPSVDVVTRDVTYYAQFTSETAKYTVTWTNWDGTVLEVDEGVPYGTKPTYDGKTPTKADDVEYTYTFSSWYPYVTGYLTEDVTYVARFTSEYRRYKVTWKNWDGSVLRVDEVEYGRTPSYSGETPTKPRTDTEAFDFVGWDKPQASVEGEQTYVAVFDDVRIYQVKYNLDGGSASDIENTYKRVNETYFLTNVIPTKAGYRFVGWNNVHESRVYQPGNYFDGNFDVEFFAIWERYEPCSTCEGDGYTAETCTDCNGQGEWDTTCTGGFTSNGTHYEGTKCPNCGTKYGFKVINGIGNVCSSCYNNYGMLYQGTDVLCTRCSGKGKIHHTCDSCNKLGYTAVTCTSCEGRGGAFEAAPTVSYKTTTKVELVYIEGYEYSKDGRNWQASPLFENLAINTQYTFYQRRASTEAVPFGATSRSLVVTTDNYYSVTYELNGGSSNYNPERYADNTETVLSGAGKTGYTFLGWYDADGNKIEALGNGIYGDLVLYARWNDGNLYTVSFNVNGGDSEIEPITVQYGKEYTLPTPVRTGYKFSHWYTNTNGYIPSPSIQGTWTIVQDVELTAYWEAIYYNITYVLDGGYYEYGQARYSYKIEAETFTLSHPQKTGYTFIGWTYEGQDTPVLDVTIPKGSTGDKEFTAHWAGNKYTVTLDANGGVIEDGTIDVIYGDVYTLPTPTRTGYTFDGWYNGDVKYSSGTWEATENLEVVAKWKANSYEVTLNDTAAPDITVCFDYQSDSHYNHTVTLSNGRILERPLNPKRENYVFTGWYTDSTCTARYDFTGVITDDMTLYAGWMPMNGSLAYSQIQIDPSDYTSSTACYTMHTATHYTTSTSYITYIYMVAEETGIHSIYWKNSSTSSSYSYYIGITNLSTQASIGCDVEVNTLSYRSCTFACSKGDIIVIQLFSNGYSSTAQLFFSGFGKPPASDCIAAPRCEYEEQSTYKYLVEYDKNGMLPTPIRPNYTFLGWYNGEEKVEPGVWKIAGDTTLVAKWERIEYEITYNLDGGTNAGTNPSYYTQDDKITLAPPTKLGYEFLGWTGSNGEVPELEVSFSGEELIERVYTAVWKPLEYSVTFKNEDGTVLETQEGLHYGDSVSYNGEIPSKVYAEDYYVYSFCGWDKELVVSGNMTFVAQYSEKHIPVTAIFQNYDGTELYRTSVEFGETATYVGETPTRPDFDTTEFTFYSWVEYSNENNTVIYRAKYYGWTRGLTFSGSSVTGYQGTSTFVYIPAEFNGYQITTITSSALSNSNIKAIYLPDTIEHIGNGAFDGCGITSIDLPDGLLTIGDGAFRSTNLVSIKIPDSVTSIGSYAFYNCRYLESVVLSKNMSQIGAGMFEECRKLSCVEMQNGIKTIASRAFYNCSELRAITLPDSVTEIGEEAFAKSGVLEITIPASVKVIEKHTFYSSAIVSVTLPAALEKIDTFAFSECRSLVSIEIPNSVTIIGEYAFKDCIALQEANIPSGFTSIPVGLFYNCSSLASIELPSNLYEIKDSAFYCCSSLTDVSFPSSLRHIGNNAFAYCSSIDTLVLDNLLGIGTGAFNGCASITLFCRGSFTTNESEWSSQGIKFYRSDEWIYKNGVPTPII